MTTPALRLARDEDRSGIWSILEPVIRAGETYALDRDMTREAALAYWFAPGREVRVAVDGDDGVLGTYFLCANHGGGGAHVANCGYAVAETARGRGVARVMALDSFDRAREAGFRAMQFNFVISSNVAAIHLWRSLSFADVGRLPGAFDHPRLGMVDALVMMRRL